MARRSRTTGITITPADSWSWNAYILWQPDKFQRTYDGYPLPMQAIFPGYAELRVMSACEKGVSIHFDGFEYGQFSLMDNTTEKYKEHIENDNREIFRIKQFIGKKILWLLGEGEESA